MAMVGATRYAKNIVFLHRNSEGDPMHTSTHSWRGRPPLRIATPVHHTRVWPGVSPRNAGEV